MRVPQSVALAFHGHYFRANQRRTFCSDFAVAASNFDVLVSTSLHRANATTRVYFHTYRSGCKPRDDWLVAKLRPVSYVFKQHLLPRIADSYIAVLRLVLDDPVTSAAILLLRFDVQFGANLTSIPLLWSKVNVPRVESDAFLRCGLVSDLFLCLLYTSPSPRDAHES
eukprot:6440963-Prymnesium_polylepis.1